MNKLFESNALKYGLSNELLISSNETEEDQSEFYDNNLEYVTDITIPISTEEILQSPENIPPERDLDESTFEILRGDEAKNNILPTVSETIGVYAQMHFYAISYANLHMEPTPK